MNLGILSSGYLGYTTLLDIIKSNICYIKFIYTDKNSSEIINLANKYQIPIFIGNPRNDKSLKFIKKYTCDIIFSINYIFIVNDFIYNHPKLYSINLHGSLLPKYRGRTPHVWAIINNERFTGITAHLINEGCDDGDIVYQYKIKIKKKYTGNDLLNIYNSKYPKIIFYIIYKIKNNKLKKIKQNHKLATYFGKRIPDDGLIDWNWQKERIKNWVRAQSNPYPGAFTYYKNSKIIIDIIKDSEFGYNEKTKNGTILSIEPLIVKTPNGCLEIVSHRGINEKLKINNTFK